MKNKEAVLQLLSEADNKIHTILITRLMKLFLEGKIKEALKEEDTQIFTLYTYKDFPQVILLPLHLILQEVSLLQEVGF